VQWVVFERSFELPLAPVNAEIHLFAVHRYRLVVNGAVVGHGPARFVRGLERYDSHDLRSYLVAGANRIVVEIAFIDCNNYQHSSDDHAGFVAWGLIDAGGSRIDLCTPGDWRCGPGRQWLDPTPLFSFAIGPVEIRDLRVEHVVNQPPVLVDAPVPDEPRDIPEPDDGLIDPVCLFIAGVNDDERRIGLLSMHPTSRSNHHQPTRGSFFRYATFLLSPREQQVNLGLHWGPHFLNGHRLQTSDDPNRGNRQNAAASFRAGWNLLCGQVEQLQPIYPLLVGLPTEAGLVARSRPDLADRGLLRFQHARELPDAERWHDHAPADAASLGLDDAGWMVVPGDGVPPIPARMMSWDLLDPSSRVDRPTLPRRGPGNTRTFTGVFDFAQEFLGHVVVELECPGETVVDLGYDERIRADGALAWFVSSPFVESADRFVLPAGRHRIETFHPRGGRYIQLTVRSQTDDASNVVLRRLSVRDARCLPDFDRAESFRSDHALLQWTWDTALRTLQASIEDVHCDSPWRERGAYLGDSYVQSMVELHVTGDRRVIRRTLRLFAAAQRGDGQLPCVVPAWYRDPHGDFTLLYAVWLHDYWQATGEDDIARECLPAVDRLLASPTWTVSRHSCLWDATSANRLFIDWGCLKLARTLDENGVLNALRYRALICASCLHASLGDPARSASYRRDAERVADDYRARLWLDGSGRFAGGTVDGKPLESDMLHGNILALAYGLADGSREPRLADYVVRRLLSNAAHALRSVPADDFAELYFLKFALDALERIGRHDVAMQVIVDHVAPMRDAGAPTFWECLHRGIVGQGSLCHSWSTASLEYLARHTGS
jgi:hypothetical protein